MRPNTLYDTKFTDFLATQEADPRCGKFKLKLRDWLLTIVQRCPRYLLLLEDFISCTNKGDSAHSGLIAVHTLVLKCISHVISISTHFFTSYALSKHVSAYTRADTFSVSSTASYIKFSSETHQSWSHPTQTWVLVSRFCLCNTNFFFSPIVSYGSPLSNLILGIGIGVGVAAVSVKLGWYFRFHNIHQYDTYQKQDSE